MQPRLTTKNVFHKKMKIRPLKLFIERPTYFISIFKYGRLKQHGVAMFHSISHISISSMFNKGILYFLYVQHVELYVNYWISFYQIKQWRTENKMETESREFIP